MNLLNALHVLGYGGFWFTGLNARDCAIQRALGLGDDDELLGFLFVGTPVKAPSAAARPSPQDFVREWP